MRLMLPAAIVFAIAACQPAPAAADREILASPPAVPVAAGPRVVIGDRVVPVEVADTEASRRQGLSGRASLAENTGLVLFWNEPTVTGIWMPDMNFAIDVIFAAGGHIVDLYTNAQPCPPGGPCPVFGPREPVNWVLEVPAGSALAWNLQVGQAIRLDR